MSDNNVRMSTITTAFNSLARQAQTDEQKACIYTCVRHLGEQIAKDDKDKTVTPEEFVRSCGIHENWEKLAAA